MSGSVRLDRIGVFAILLRQLLAEALIAIEQVVGGGVILFRHGAGHFKAPARRLCVAPSLGG